MLVATASASSTIPTPEEPTGTGQLPSGPAVAAMLSIGIGGLLMALVVGLSDANKAFENDVVHAIGKAWVPGAQGIGPYSGKFTVFLVGWLVSWAVLHFALKGTDVDLSRWTLL